MEKELMLRTKEITKSFSTTRALVDVSIDFFKGEIRGLIGENGSGKSTLVNVIAGQLKQDAGTLEYKGEPYIPHDTFDATNKKVSMIIQEMGTLNGLTVSANLFLGREYLFEEKGGLINTRRMRKEALNALAKIGVDYLNPDDRVDRLPFEDRKIIEMARALYTEPDVLIVDETTTALPQKGRDILYQIMDDMKASGKLIIFISHDLDEVLAHCDSVSVMRDGHFIETRPISECNPDNVRLLMVGRNIDGDYYRSDYDGSFGKKAMLEAKDIHYKDIINDVSFSLHEGEILGLAGLTECGMHELGKVLFGLIIPDYGTVSIRSGEKMVPISKPIDAIRASAGYISKNRDQEALMLNMSIKDNIALASLDSLKKGMIIPKKAETKLADKGAAEMQVKMRDLNQFVSNLSGGNKQKVVLARWIAAASEILIMDCPTRGIDIGVKAYIYQLMRRLKKEGRAMLMISEELTEIIGMCDRVIVMKNGSVTNIHSREEHMTEASVIRNMI